jgi:hypothetical protein
MEGALEEDSEASEWEEGMDSLLDTFSTFYCAQLMSCPTEVKFVPLHELFQMSLCSLQSFVVHVVVLLCPSTLVHSLIHLLNKWCFDTFDASLLLVFVIVVFDKKYWPVDCLVHNETLYLWTCTRNISYYLDLWQFNCWLKNLVDKK